jgi:hypothetical protein
VLSKESRRDDFDVFGRSASSPKTEIPIAMVDASVQSVKQPTIVTASWDDGDCTDLKIAQLLLGELGW